MNFRQFLEVNHGEHKSTEYYHDNNLAVQLRLILEKIQDKKLIVKFALNCAKDTHPQNSSSIECIKLVEKWLKDESSVTRQQLYDVTVLGDYNGNWSAYTTAAADVVETVISVIRDDSTMFVIHAIDAAYTSAYVSGNYEKNMKHYISIAQGLLSSTSKYKTNIPRNLEEDNEEDFVTRLCALFDQIDIKDDEENIFLRDSGGLYLNLPEFTPPVRIRGKDHEDLAKKIWNSRFRHSLFNYISHLH